MSQNRASVHLSLLPVNKSFILSIAPCYDFRHSLQQTGSECDASTQTDPEVFLTPPKHRSEARCVGSIVLVSDHSIFRLNNAR